MQHLTIRLLVLLVMIGFLVFSSMTTSKAGACDGACRQACWVIYEPCLAHGQGDFFQCCMEYNACLQDCGCNPKCQLPIEYP
jgi:hypothetical protein